MGFPQIHTLQSQQPLTLLLSPFLITLFPFSHSCWQHSNLLFKAPFFSVLYTLCSSHKLKSGYLTTFQLAQLRKHSENTSVRFDELTAVSKSYAISSLSNLWIFLDCNISCHATATFSVEKKKKKRTEQYQKVTGAEQKKGNKWQNQKMDLPAGQCTWHPSTHCRGHFKGCGCWHVIRQAGPQLLYRHSHW